MSDEQQSSLGAFSDDEAALQRGKTGTLVTLALLAVAALVGAWLLLSGGDEARVYGEIGKKINGLRQAHFDQFWGCALPTANLKDITTNTQLMSQIDGRAADGGTAYGLHVREKCLSMLRDIEPELDTLIIPAELQPELDHLKDATSKLRGSWSALISYLDNPELHYDSEAARMYIEHIARGWFDFKQAHGKINKVLKEKLGDAPD